MGTQKRVLCANCRLLSFALTTAYGQSPQHHLYPTGGARQARMGLCLQWLWRVLLGRAMPGGRAFEWAQNRCLQSARLGRCAGRLPLRRINRAAPGACQQNTGVDALGVTATGSAAGVDGAPVDISGNGL